MKLRDRIETGLEHWGRLMVRHCWWVLVLALAFLVAAGSFVPLMRVENSSQSYLHSDDEESIRYDEFCEQFGQDDQILIAITPPDVFAPDFLARLRDLHEELEDGLPHVTEVNSLINARRTRGEDDMLIVEDLMAEWPQTAAEFAALRERVLSNPLYLDTLISRDGRTTTLTIEPALYSAGDGADPLADLDAGFDEGVADPAGEPAYLSNEEQEILLDALDGILQRYERADIDVQIVGGPVTTNRLTAMMNADVEAYMGMAGLAIALFLYALFRRLSGVLLPMLIVAAAMVSTLGTMVWVDIPFSLVLGMLPIFTMTVGVCTTVHVLVVVYRQVGAGRTREDAVAHAFHHSGLAICMASATTAAGMFSFMTADVVPIRQLGMIAPFAVFYAFVFTMTLLPALIALTPMRARAWGAKRAGVPISEKLLVWTGTRAVRHARFVVISALLFTVFLCFGAARLRFAHEPISWFPEDDPTRVGVETVDRVLRGSSNVEVVIDTGTENGLYEPETLKRIEAAMQLAEGMVVGPIFVGKALSLVDIVKESHEALSQGRPEARVIPDSRPVIAQELLLFENGGADDLEKFTDSQFRRARLSLRLPESDAVGYQRFLEELEAGLAITLGDELDFFVTGRTMITASVMSALITSMGRSYLFALLVITPLMILLVGDLRLGLISMAPNLFPVIFVLGVMGWFDIPLDASNIVIGSVVISLAVDDTIHFLQRFRKEYAHERDIEAAVRETMRVTGAALFFTTLVLATGFLVMALRGSMLNTVFFGVLTAAGIGFAFLADVVTTPALITLTGRRHLDEITAGIEEPPFAPELTRGA